jgi:hypothetical protein
VFRFHAGQVRRLGNAGALLAAAFAILSTGCDVSEDGLGSQLAVPTLTDGATGIGPTTDARTDRGAPGPSIDPEPPDAQAPRPDGGPDRAPPPRDGAAPDAAPPRDAGAMPDSRVDVTPPQPTPDAPPAARQLLLLVGSTPLSPGDLALSNRLTTLGFGVSVKVATTPAQVTETRTALLTGGFALVVLSASLPQGSGLPADIRMLPVPIFFLKSAFCDNLGVGIQGENYVSPGETELQIRLPDHPMAAGRRGTIAVVSQARPFGLAKVIPAAIIVATIAEEADEAVIFGVEKGAADRFGPVAARRVGWFGQEPTFLSLNATGWALFDAAVRWAATTP